MRLAHVSFVVVVLGCSGADDETSSMVPPAECAAGEWLRDGACIPAGVPPDGCGQGFVHDGDHGCEPILPAEPCAPGFMAVPGERSCREVAPCAAGQWGDIPVEPDTEHVDATFLGMDSDGSALKPWTTIQAAVDVAAPGAIVAIAEGLFGSGVIVLSEPSPATATITRTRIDRSALAAVGAWGRACSHRRLEAQLPGLRHRLRTLFRKPCDPRRSRRQSLRLPRAKRSMQG